MFACDGPEASAGAEGHGMMMSEPDLAGAVSTTSADDGIPVCRRCGHRNGAGLSRCERCKSWLRDKWLSQLAGLIASAIRLDTLLGLARRSAHVPSPLEYWSTRRRPESPEEEGTKNPGRSPASPCVEEQVEEQRPHTCEPS